MDDGESGTNVVFAGEELELEEQQSCMIEPINREILEIKIAQLESENEKLMKENRKLLEDNAFLATKVSRGFSIDNIKDDQKLFSFYTGLPDYETFKILFDSFGSAVNNLVYIDSNTNRNKINSPSYTKRSPKRNLTPEQEFFLALVRLRLGLLEEDLAYRAGVSTSSFSRIWITWLDFLHSKFRAFPIWPSKSCVQKTMHSCFKESYPNTRVIIDCTEIFIERPSSVQSQSSTFSHYKHHNTAKGLIGITPAGTVSFVSDLYTGRTSDKIATRDSKSYNLLEAGDSLMADKGFDKEEDLPNGVSLNIPPFLRGKDCLSIEEEQQTRQIAAVRIHVERAISRVKTYRILQHVFQISMAADLNKIWIVVHTSSTFYPL